MANFTKIPASTQQSQVIAALNGNFAKVSADGVTKVFKDSNGVPTIIMGILPDGTTGIVISKPGVDVLTYF
jgi:hypothetical protein